MKKYLSLVAGLAFAASSSMAFAQAAAPQAAEGAKMADCSKEESPDKKAYCEAKNAAMESCKDKKGDEMKACVKDAMMKKEAK
jgi:hypothetical protein